MIRKQLYIEEEQDTALKARAKDLGVSEAEVVRRALDAELRSGASERSAQLAVDAFLRAASSLTDEYGLPADYRFDRQGLYEEDPRFTSSGEE